MDLELSGKRILITGSYRGTGAGLARVMAREGATVWVHGFELAPAEAVAQSIRDEGFEAHAVEGDIRTDEGAAQVASGVGEIDVLVNNYGVAEGGTWESPTADWIDIYNRLYRERIIFLGQEIDDEIANQVRARARRSAARAFRRVVVWWAMPRPTRHTDRWTSCDAAAHDHRAPPASPSRGRAATSAPPGGRSD